MKNNNFLFREKPVKIMIMLLTSSYKEINIRDLSRETDTIYPHVVNLIKIFEERNLIAKEKVGRKQIITLTVKGREIADKIDKIRMLL